MAYGQQFVAPNGCGTLKAGARYHYLIRDQTRSRVLLIGMSNKSVWLEFMTTSEYDKAIEKKTLQLVLRDEMRRMPPWLERYENQHLEDEIATLYKKRTLVKVECESEATSSLCNFDIVNDRQSRIRHVLETYELVFTTIDPIQELNRLARACVPKVNQKRFRRWVLTALAFPCNIWALLPPPGGRGKYEREPARGRHGRARLDGKDSGYDVVGEMKSLIVEGFHHHSREGMRLSEVYTNVLEYTFGCAVREGMHGFESYHPYGAPFPSYGQFRYWCYQMIGEEVVKRTLLGDIEYHNKYEAPKGSYSEGSQDILQVGHMDVGYTKVYPTSALSGYLLPKLAIAKVVCQTTGLILGCAAGFNGESESLYRQALFAAGIPKSKLGQILGMTIKDADWPTDLLPMNVHSDRGPGQAISIRKIHEGMNIFHSMSPSYSPQTNSPVEAKHDKQKDVAGRPSHLQSPSSPLQLFRTEIMKMIKKNKTANVIRRATPHQMSRGLCTPHSLHVDYMNRHRVAGLAMPFEELVKAYLPAIELIVSNGHIEYKSIRYSSERLTQTKFLREIRKHEGAVIRGFCLEICTHILWIVIDGQLIEVSARDQVIAGKDSNNMTMQEHAQHDLTCRIAEGDLKAARAAGAVWQKQEAEKANGGASVKPRLKAGQPKARNRVTKAEASAMRP